MLQKIATEMENTRWSWGLAGSSGSMDASRKAGGLKKVCGKKSAFIMMWRTSIYKCRAYLSKKRLSIKVIISPIFTDRMMWSGRPIVASIFYVSRFCRFIFHRRENLRMDHFKVPTVGFMLLIQCAPPAAIHWKKRGKARSWNVSHATRIRVFDIGPIHVHVYKFSL
jgi:hypothetical protein